MYINDGGSWGDSDKEQFVSFWVTSSAAAAAAAVATTTTTSADVMQLDNCQAPANSRSMWQDVSHEYLLLYTASHKTLTIFSWLYLCGQSSPIFTSFV